ncbi:MAG: hypothetical protein HYZ49_19090 [Chloroflexi bacterium]|nr:hypothetical protein [Chloroflexota bacterium]
MQAKYLVNSSGRLEFVLTPPETYPLGLLFVGRHVPAEYRQDRRDILDPLGLTRRGNGAVMLSIIAAIAGGISSQFEIEQLLGQAELLKANPESDITRRSSAYLQRDGFLAAKKLNVPLGRTAHRAEVTALSLTEKGVVLARKLSIEPVVTDYEQLARNHRADDWPEHTAACLHTISHARLRGIPVEVAPVPVGVNSTSPDLIFRESGSVYGVEVQRRVEKSLVDKLRSNARYNEVDNAETGRWGGSVSSGFAAVVVLNEEQRRKLIELIYSDTRLGMACVVTDLMYLRSGYAKGLPFWVERGKRRGWWG